MVLLAAFGARPARSDWPSDPSVNVPLSAAAGDQGHPHAISDGSGGAIVIWTDNRNGSANADIYAQRVNLAGAVLWAPNGDSLCTVGGNQINPSIIPDGSGGAIVVWEDYRGGTNNSDIYAQRVNAAGVPQWTVNGVAICTAPNDQVNPTIAPDGAGGAIITWSDQRTDFGDIYAQRVDATGAAQWSADGVPVCAAIAIQASPTIAPDGAGGAIITWQDLRSGSEFDIYAQRMNAAGVPQWAADGVALGTSSINSFYPLIVSDGAGGAIVAWYYYHCATAPCFGTETANVFIQRVTASGTALWGVNGHELDYDTSENPWICSDGAGGAIVAWESYRPLNASTYDLYAQRVSGAGVELWASGGVPVCVAPYNQTPSGIVPDGMGGAVIAWDDNRFATPAYAYAQRLNGAGVPQWTTNGVDLSTSTYQLYPTIASDGAGGGIVAWGDYRSGTHHDIYAQNIRADGALGGSLVSVPGQPVEAGPALRLWPNPGGGSFNVSYSLTDGPGSLDLFDIVGRRVESQALERGTHVVTFPARTCCLPSGVYRVRLETGNHRSEQNVVVIR